MLIIYNVKVVHSPTFHHISKDNSWTAIQKVQYNMTILDQIHKIKEIADNQPAYRTDFSTTDQIFISRGLMNRYICVKIEGQIVWMFCSIWHKGLMYKLLTQYNRRTTLWCYWKYV